MGICVYLFFRDLTRIIFFAWVPLPDFIKPALAELSPSIFSSIVMHNTAGMLWFVSGIMFLRFVYMINQGIDVESQGGHTHGGSWSDSHEFTYTSIDIPVLLRYNFFHGFFGLLIGPHISIPLMGDYVDDIQVTFGITAGVQGFFPLGAGFLVGDVRFIADFNEIVDGSDWHRQALVISVGYEWSF